MTLVNAAVVGLANFVFIFLKAFQQRNVAFLHYWWVVPTSFAMATVEIFVIGTVAVQAAATDGSTFIEMVDALWPLVVACGLGGGTGAVSSMWVHTKIHKRKSQPMSDEDQKMMDELLVAKRRGRPNE